jgi:hypothetical protein
MDKDIDKAGREKKQSKSKKVREKDKTQQDNMAIYSAKFSVKQGKILARQEPGHDQCL